MAKRRACIYLTKSLINFDVWVTVEIWYGNKVSVNTRVACST